jgi:hypothetical protein
MPKLIDCAIITAAQFTNNIVVLLQNWFVSTIGLIETENQWIVKNEKYFFVQIGNKSSTGDIEKSSNNFHLGLCCVCVELLTKIYVIYYNGNIIKCSNEGRWGMREMRQQT